MSTVQDNKFMGLPANAPLMKQIERAVQIAPTQALKAKMLKVQARFQKLTR